jgi:hypothetical protein
LAKGNPGRFVEITIPDYAVLHPGHGTQYFDTESRTMEIKRRTLIAAAMAGALGRRGFRAWRGT